MRRSTVFVLALAFTISATQAAAYEIMQTGDGVPVFWDDSEIAFVMDQAGTSQLSIGAAEQTIADSLDAWDRIPSTDLTIRFDGRVENEVVGFDWEHNVNLIAFYDGGWTFSTQALAITLSTWSVPSGRLLDADVAVNTADYDWAVDGRAGAFDLASALTHEFGHAVGLGHSQVHDATMFASMTTGEVHKRDLHIDDVNGYLFLYGAEDVVQPDEPTTPPVDEPHTGTGEDTPSDYDPSDQPPTEPADEPTDEPADATPDAPEMPTPDPDDTTPDPAGGDNDQPAGAANEPTPDDPTLPNLGGSNGDNNGGPASGTPEDYQVPEHPMANFELSCSATGAGRAGNLTPLLMLLAGLMALVRRRRSS